MVSKITGYSARQQSRTAFWLAVCVYTGHTINMIRVDNKWASLSAAFMIFILFTHKSHIWTMGDLSTRLPEQERAWAHELRTRTFLRTIWTLLAVIQFPYDVYRLVFEHNISPNLGLLFMLYALYVSLIPQGKQQSLYSKAKNKLKELAKAIQPQPRLIPIPIGA